MSTASIQFFSDGLGRWTRYNANLPDEGEGPFPVLMQLHGLSDDASVFRIADGLAGRDDLPVNSFDCGVDDELIDHNRAFHEHLQALNIEHRYREHPGAHTWDYWDEHVVEALPQHARVLGLA